MEYNVLIREWNKRDKQIIEDAKIQEKLKIIKERRQE
jgi:hypothetical protein